MDLSLDYLPRLPRRKDFRIGCVGAGFIMRDCHLVAERHGIHRVHTTYADLLADREIEVLDIAVPPDVQPDIIREAVLHKDHLRGILAQKPLAMSFAEAKKCVDLCAEAGIALAVNQNMRY